MALTGKGKPAHTHSLVTCFAVEFIIRKKVNFNPRFNLPGERARFECCVCVCVCVRVCV